MTIFARNAPASNYLFTTSSALQTMSHATQASEPASTKSPCPQPTSYRVVDVDFAVFLISAFVDCNPEAVGNESPLWDGGVDCTLEWVQDGRSLGQAGKNTALTRRLRLSTTNKSISDAYLVLMAPEGQSHRFLGRSINPLRIDVHMIHRWLGDCEKYHGTKCAPLSAASTE
ncbi:hypothetical protein BKA63DRAFT_97457 [Paraphoma chrysanthemicola]|nr:hypothetical protein BKA63DRAFT_97457 [Paraphoma chrysanthemicola]